MLEKDFVTIVLTTCKREPEIVARAVLSIVNQTYQYWELIIVDDSPGEYELRAEVKRRVLSVAPSDRLTYIQNPENKGACYSRNIGLNKARGEFIAYIDDDDEWLPEKLEKQVTAFHSSDSNVALVYGPFYKVYEQSQKREMEQLIDVSGIKFRDLLFMGNPFGGMSMPLLRTECVTGVGGFDELMQSSQDTDLWLRLFRSYEVKYLDIPLVLYHVHEGEQISSNPIKKIRGIERINEKYKEYLENDAELWWKRHSILIMYYVRNKEKGKAFSIWWQCVKKAPGKIVLNLRYLLGIIL